MGIDISADGFEYKGNLKL